MSLRLGLIGTLSIALLSSCSGEDKDGDFGNGGTPRPVPDLTDDSSDSTVGDDTSGGGGDDTSGGGGSDSATTGDDTSGGGPGDDTSGGGGDDTSGGGGDSSSSGGDSSATSTEGSFDEPGDVVSYEDEDAIAEISLADESGDSNLNQEFYAIVVNTTDDEISYRLRYEDAGHASDTGPGGPPPPARRPAETPFRASLRSARALGELRDVPPPPEPPPALGTDDIGTTEREFRVRNDLEDDETYDLVDATLWAVGDSVAIWVDNDVPIDWDKECDGIVDEEDHYDAYGFDNCDLQTIADIVDANIFPNVSSLFGEVSDVNGDGLVSVVITPVLNVLPLTSEDEDDWSGVVESYADPEVDLTEWDADSNPGSDEQEVIYVFAPDPYGAYNALASTTVDEYTSMSLAAQIARAYLSLISYNMHVLEADGDAEEQWLNDALGALAADLVGFGAVYYDDAWTYADAPHLNPLVAEEEEGSISTAKVGAQYLFARWLADAYGTDILSDIVGSSSTGTDAIEEATGEEFVDLVIRWQVALLTTGVTTGDGERLVTDATYSPYVDATMISAPTSDPLPGDYYGANGYQSGINVAGINSYMEGGTTESPTENTDNRVKMGNTDHYTHVTGMEFYGYIAENYAAQVVRLVGLPYAGTALQIQASDDGFAGAVVRWNDPASTDVAVEDVFSATDANNMELSPIPVGDAPIYAVGELTDPAKVVMVSADGEEETVDVYDTDRWLIDLSERGGEDVTLAIWLDRRFDDSGDSTPDDPWLAVVPSSFVPTPTVDGTSSGTCDTGAVFGYPASILEYLYYQVFLSTEPYSDDDEFDACGTPSGATTTCDEDWDFDGVLDDDEPQPGSLLEQVWVMQCTLAGGDSTAFDPLGSDYIDVDSTDDDEDPYVDMAQNLGGLSGSSGEEAYLEVTLDGGGTYVLVVGSSGGGTGSYEVTLQPL